MIALPHCAACKSIPAIPTLSRLFQAFESAAAFGARQETDHAFMLQSIRKGARSWLGIVLAFILIPPFAIVGVEYIFRDGFSRAEAVITVGDAQVLGREYERAFRRQMDAIRQRTGQSIDYKTAKSLGVVDLVANSMVTEALYRQASTDNGILIGDAVIRSAVRDLPALKGVDGTFDPARYQALLQNLRMTENQFLETRRAAMASQFLVQSVARVNLAPDVLVDAVDKYRNEKRVADFFTLRASSVTSLPDPTDKQLEAFHERNKTRYTQSANRAVSALIVNPEDVFERIKVTDGEIKAIYDRDRSRYTKPEKRSLRQLVFAEEAEAKKAYEAMVGGRTFDAVAKEVVKRKPLDLGTVSAKQVPLPALAKAAFAVKEGEVTPPVKTSLGWHLVIADKVEPRKITPLKDVRDDIERAIKLKRSGKILDQLREDTDDALGAGLKLDKIASQLKLKLRTIPAIDARGNDADGKAIKGLPRHPRFLQQIFKQKVNDYLELIETKGGAFFVVQVDKINPSRVLPVKEIRDRVVTDWKADARLKALKVKADSFVKMIRDGKSIKEAAAAADASLKGSSPLSRYGRTGDSEVSPDLRDALFKAKQGAVVAAPGVGGYSVAVLTDIEIGGKDAKKQRQAIADNLKRSIGQELLSQYDTMLRKRYPVSINRDDIDKLFSRQNQRQQQGS